MRCALPLISQKPTYSIPATTSFTTRLNSFTTQPGLSLPNWPPISLQDDIDAVNTLSASYLTALPAKRAAVSAQKASTTNIKNAFKDIDKLFKDKLDNLIILFQVPNASFYNEYKASRIIIDLGIRHDKDTTIITGTVENFETEFPIPEAYVWVVEKMGYETYTEDPVTIAKGDEIILDIMLEPKG